MEGSVAGWIRSMDGWMDTVDGSTDKGRPVLQVALGFGASAAAPVTFSPDAEYLRAVLGRVLEVRISAADRPPPMPPARRAGWGVFAAAPLVPRLYSLLRSRFVRASPRVLTRSFCKRCACSCARAASWPAGMPPLHRRCWRPRRAYSGCSSRRVCGRSWWSRCPTLPPAWTAARARHDAQRTRAHAHAHTHFHTE